MGIESFHDGDLEEAEEYFIKAIEYGQRSHTTFSNLAQVEEKLGKYGKALEHYNYVLSEDAYFKDALIGRGRCLIELKKYDIAQISLRKYLKIEENSTEGLYLAANCYFKERDYYTALNYLEKANKIDPNYTDALYLRGVLEGRLGFQNKAEHLFFKVLELNPQMYQSYYGLATLHFMSGEFNDALEYYSIAENNGVESEELISQKGLCYLNLKRSDKACEEFKKIKDNRKRNELLSQFCNM